jgi:TnpA family transposase
VAVEFLTDAQVAAYGRFDGVPSRADLERFFLLDDADKALIGDRRGDHSRLGFMLQATTVRYLGVFLENPLDVPLPVVEYLAAQLGIADASCVKRYTARAKTAYEHAWEIRDAYGFRAFADPEAAAGFRLFLEGRAWTHAEGPYRLFGQAAGWLRRNRVLLPGVSVLARLVASVREAAADRMHRVLAGAAADADPALPSRLGGLLVVPDGQRFSELERLRQAPRRTSGKAMTGALDRVSEVLALGARSASVEVVPANRLAALARYGLAAKAPALRDLAEPRKTATLLATARHLEAAAVDDALDLFDVLMATRLISVARRASAAERLAAMPRLERASATLAGAAKALVAALDGGGAWLDVTAAWAAVERVAPREDVLGAVAVVEELVPDDAAGDAAMREALTARYGVVRPFLELLAEALPLGAAPAGEKLLAEVRRLPELARRRVKARHLSRDEVSASLVAAAWQRVVYRNPALPPDAADRDAYVLCILEQLHRALRRRDIFASPSVRWADPRAQLLDGDGWDGVRDEILTGLGLAGPASGHLAGLVRELDAAWRLLADRMAGAGQDAPVRLVPEDDGRIRLAVDRLEAIGEPESLTRLRETVAAMLPRVDLPDLLLEVHGWTGFLEEYTHVGERGPRMDGLPVSVAALLVAEACNVGLTPVTDPNNPALTRGRLSHVDQNYLRADTHSAANARLVDAQASIGVAQLWGGGLVASADGLRFVVPVQTINALPSPRYFGRGRGVTWLNAINDQVAGIGAVVVPGTMRDSLHILDTMLNLDAGPKPEMVATDTASYSDIVFGLFRLLGYRFSPRIADLSDQRFWRATLPGAPEGDYGPLNALARHRVSLAKICAHWDDMTRVAGSLVTSQVRAYDLLRMLGRDGHPTALGTLYEPGRSRKSGAAAAPAGRRARRQPDLAVVQVLLPRHARRAHAARPCQQARGAPGHEAAAPAAKARPRTRRASQRQPGRRPGPAGADLLQQRPARTGIQRPDRQAPPRRQLRRRHPQLVHLDPP